MDRASRMDAIDSNTTSTLSHLSHTNTLLTAVLCAVLVTAVLAAIAISVGLTRALQSLAGGMDRLAVLQLPGVGEKPAAEGEGLSRFTEVSRCELSFLALRRYCNTHTRLALSLSLSKL